MLARHLTVNGDVSLRRRDQLIMITTREARLSLAYGNRFR
jgi:hypothetical protein